jgi:2-deoxy-D-gluconate 3-dehydrogenase
MIDLSAFSLEGKTIMVTGANSGIGQGIAIAAARAGARILGVGRSEMEETSSAISGHFTAIRCDLTDFNVAINMLSEAWDAYGPIDGLVNNAGIIRRTDATDHSDEDWDDILDINLKTLFFLSRTFGQRALATKRTGKIVNIASLLSFQGGIRVAAYTASKHGVAGITKSLANEWAANGINVNGIAPGYIETKNTTALREDPARSAEILKRLPAGRWGTPSDIGDAAVFLLSSAANYMHGAIIPVDGGWLAR